jgi:hypothetical protein
VTASAAGGWRARVGPHRGSIAWMLVVVAVYVVAVAPQRIGKTGAVDRAMQLAINAVEGRWDLAPLVATFDMVTIDGLQYQAISPLPIVPYLLFVPFPGLWNAAFWIIPTVLGIVASWIALPLARAYGAVGARAYWVATLAAFGTLLFTQATHANFYYLAHVEAVLCCFVALWEWQGRRRPWVIGLALALAGLARPTVLLAVIPFGIALVVRARGRRLPAIDVRRLVTFSLPVVVSLLVVGWYDWVRFGSPFENGYSATQLGKLLADRRAQGLFSVRHLPENLGLIIAGGFDLRARFPYLVPNENGHALLLTSPGLLIAVGAGFRAKLPVMLWTTVLLIAATVLLYYGFGGRRTFGYRYALDFIPFLIPLVALAVRDRFGALERLLIILSVAFVFYGVIWQLFRYW